MRSSSDHAIPRPGAVRERLRHHLVKFRLNEVIRVQNLQKFRLGGKIQRAVQVSEQAEIPFVADVFAGEAREIA